LELKISEDPKHAASAKTGLLILNTDTFKSMSSSLLTSEEDVSIVKDLEGKGLVSDDNTRVIAKIEKTGYSLDTHMTKEKLIDLDLQKAMSPQ
jgi:uncharacterized protein YcgL (UPF0745 family)